MPERDFPIRQFGVDYICDACNAGVMELSGVMLLCDPPKWPHKCNTCESVVNFTEKYPTVRTHRLPAD